MQGLGWFCETKRYGEKLRRIAFLLSLFIASSIQQGGASEPGVQPGHAGASAKRGGGWGGSGGVGKEEEDGACVSACDG